MQSRKDCAVRIRKLPVSEGLERCVVAQDGAQTVKVSCFMGRRDPLPVAVSLRNFGDVGRGGFSIRASPCSCNEGDKAGHCRKCNQEECEVFHGGSSIWPAFYSNPIGFGRADPAGNGWLM